MKNILVFGAGVIGSLYAAKLKLAGENVTILARGKRFEQLKKKGIIWQDAFSGKLNTVFPNVIDKLTPQDDYDMVAIHVRANQLTSVLPILSANKKIPIYLFMLNFPQGFHEVAKTVGEKRVILGFPGAGGMVTKVGILVASVAPGFAQPTTFGEINGEITKRLEEISQIYAHAGFPTALSTNMDAWLKTHVVWTLPFECILYKYKYNCAAIAKDTNALTIIAESIKEGIRVLHTLHIPIVPFQIQLMYGRPPLFVCKLILKAWFSSKNAEVYTARHAKNAPDEAYYLAQEFKKFIIKSGLSTPNLNKLYSYIPIH